MIISKREIIKNKIISYLLDSNEQISSCGVFLTVNRVFEFKEKGTIGFDSTFEVLPPMRELPFNSDFNLDLDKGTYFVLFNEKIKLTDKLAAILTSTESLLRTGASISSITFSPSYSGYLYCVLNTSTDFGIKLVKHAKIAYCTFQEVKDANLSTNQAIFEGIKNNLNKNGNG